MESSSGNDVHDPPETKLLDFMQGFRLLCGKTDSYAVAKIILPEQTVLQ